VSVQGRSPRTARLLDRRPLALRSHSNRYVTNQKTCIQVAGSDWAEGGALDAFLGLRWVIRGACGLALNLKPRIRALLREVLCPRLHRRGGRSGWKRVSLLNWHNWHAQETLDQLGKRFPEPKMEVRASAQKYLVAGKGTTPSSCVAPFSTRFARPGVRGDRALSGVRAHRGKTSAKI